MGFPGGDGGKEPTPQMQEAKRLELDPGLGDDPHDEGIQPTPIFSL